VDIPSKCKECQYHKKCKKIARGSKKCKIRLGIIQDEKEEAQIGTVHILWYYYNSATGLYDKKDNE